MTASRIRLSIALLAMYSVAAAAQERTLSQGLKTYASVTAQTVALTHVKVIDGTGAPARDDQTIIINGDVIQAIGKTGEVQVPAGA
jgi:hypothetical protein